MNVHIASLFQYALQGSKNKEGEQVFLQRREKGSAVGTAHAGKKIDRQMP